MLCYDFEVESAGATKRPIGAPPKLLTIQPRDDKFLSPISSFKTCLFGVRSKIHT